MAYNLDSTYINKSDTCKNSATMSSQIFPFLTLFTSLSEISNITDEVLLNRQVCKNKNLLRNDSFVDMKKKRKKNRRHSNKEQEL